MQRKLIYDMAIVYDIWFRQTEEEAGTADLDKQEEHTEKEEE